MSERKQYMSRDSKVYIEDIKEALEKIEKYTENMNLENFSKNEMVIDAVVRNFAIIGEAVKNLPQEVKNKHKNIEWKKIAGLRDILVHAYFGVNKKIVWDIVEKKVPELKEFLKKL